MSTLLYESQMQDTNIKRALVLFTAIRIVPLAVLAPLERKVLRDGPAQVCHPGFTLSLLNKSGGYETRRISPPIRFTRSSEMSSRSSSTARISRLGLGGVGGDGEAGRSSGLDSMVSTCDSACDTSCVPELELTGSIMINVAASKTGSGIAEGGRGCWMCSAGASSSSSSMGLSVGGTRTSSGGPTGLVLAAAPPSSSCAFAAVLAHHHVHPHPPETPGGFSATYPDAWLQRGLALFAHCCHMR